MPSYTPHLNLYRPDGADAFERTKFNETWDKIDAAPGVTVTTFNTRPKWGVNQAGNLLYETDTRRLLSWSGSSWVEPAYCPKTFSSSGYWNSAQGNNTTVDRTILQFTCSRSANMIGIVTVQTVVDGTGAVEWQNFQIYDGVSLSMSTHETGRYPGGVASGRDVRQTTSIWYRSSVNAGAHKITNRTIVFGGHNGINAYSFKILIMLVQ